MLVNRILSPIRRPIRKGALTNPSRLSLSSQNRSLRPSGGSIVLGRSLITKPTAKGDLQQGGLPIREVKLESYSQLLVRHPLAAASNRVDLIPNSEFESSSPLAGGCRSSQSASGPAPRVARIDNPATHFA